MIDKLKTFVTTRARTISLYMAAAIILSEFMTPSMIDVGMDVVLVLIMLGVRKVEDVLDGK